jgi:mono/diheme cytochrome c family protein
MKTISNVLIWIAGILGLAVASVLVWIFSTWQGNYSDVSYPTLEASDDPAIIERGRYLVHGPAHCSNCHVASLEDSRRADSGEDLPLSGGWEWQIGPLTVLYSANLTPDPDTGIGRYEDRELFRMLRHNVKPNGRASLAELMPFANMADDDLVAIVSYLRSSEPQVNAVPEPRWTFVGKMIMAIRRPPIFEPVLGQSPPSTAPPELATVERGEYLANYVANCKACHSPRDAVTGEFTGSLFSGSSTPAPSLVDPKVLFRTPNLTPRSGAIAGYANEDVWVTRFRAGRLTPESDMHWGPFSRMSENDLRAIYRYLRSLDPVDDEIGPIVGRTEGQ